MILAIDQGTTGTTCLSLDDDFRVCGRGYRELPQHFPRPGWVEHDVVTFVGAPHSFFDRKQEEFATASADAWALVLEFLRRHPA